MFDFYVRLKYVSQLGDYYLSIRMIYCISDSGSKSSECKRIHRCLCGPTKHLHCHTILPQRKLTGKIWCSNLTTYFCVAWRSLIGHNWYRCKYYVLYRFNLLHWFTPTVIKMESPGEPFLQLIAVHSFFEVLNINIWYTYGLKKNIHWQGICLRCRISLRMKHFNWTGCSNVPW